MRNVTLADSNGKIHKTTPCEGVTLGLSVENRLFLPQFHLAKFHSKLIPSSCGGGPRCQ
jgi:hypothetical protein